MANASNVERQCKARSRGFWPSEKAFTTIELMVSCLIAGIATSMALLIIGNLLPTLHADSSLDLVVTELHQAREQAMDERRNFIVTFTGTNEVTVQRQELPLANPTYTLIADVFLGDGMIYTIPSGMILDTPDQFDDSLAPIYFGGGTTSIIFQGDGTAVTSVGGAPVNGTVFMAIPGNPLTARAVTILGATGEIQGYRYNGSTWGQ